MVVVGHAGDGGAVIGPDLAHRVGEGLGAHALAADLGKLGVLDVVEHVADGAEAEGDPIARLGAGGGRHTDGLGAVGRAIGHGSAALARERELKAIALRPVAALERLGEESRGGDVPALGSRSVRVGERDGRAVLGHGAFGLGAVSPVNSSRVALGGILGHGVARAHGQAGDGLLPAVLKREGRLAVRKRHGVLALAEGAGDGLAVPVGQRDREAELALAVAADDRLLDGDAALAGHAVVGRVGLGFVLPHLDRGGVEDVVDHGGFGGDLHVKAERARGARSLLAERPGKGARRGVVGGTVGRTLNIVNALGQDIGHRHVGRLRGAPVVDAVIGPADGIGEDIAHAHRLAIHIDLGARGVRLGDGLGVVVRREGVGEGLLAPLVGDLGLKAGTGLSHRDVEGVGMRVVLNQDIAACFLGHGRVVGARIGEAELAKGNLAVLVILRLDWVALEDIARTVGEGELEGELPLLEAGLAASCEHLGELGDGRRGGGGVEGVGEGSGGDLIGRDGAIGPGSLGSVHRGRVALGGTFGHRVGSSRGQPRDPRRLAIFELEGRLAVLERRVTVGAGYFAAHGIGGLNHKLKYLVRVDRQALARHDGLGDVELARLHSVGHGEAALGVAGDLRAVALDGVLGHGVLDHGAGGIVLRQVREDALPAVGLAQGDRIDDGIAVLEIYFDLIRMGNPGVLPDLFDGNVDVLGLTDDDTAVGADAASQRRRIARDRQRRLAAAEVIHILAHHRFKRDVRRGVGKGQGLAVATAGRESRDFGVCFRISAFGVKQPTVSVPADLSAARSAVGQGQFVFGVFEAGEDEVVSRLIGRVPGDQATVLDVDLGISGRAEPHAAALLFRMVINNESVFDMERAIDEILVAFAIYAATHIPSSIVLDLARTEDDVI